ncbi:hypothetical protein EHYA_02104 [Embleya hyalina]|uniref:Uncharacterized protein n=1 Tax=Embleya hyalina TaxID=516124 RepID=A0A401YIJ4_9ACTN|nr:hypothetical protein EHYA_02104 [Embleya hyalina]
MRWGARLLRSRGGVDALRRGACPLRGPGPGLGGVRRGGGGGVLGCASAPQPGLGRRAAPWCVSATRPGAGPGRRSSWRRQGCVGVRVCSAAGVESTRCAVVRVRYAAEAGARVESAGEASRVGRVAGCFRGVVGMWVAEVSRNRIPCGAAASVREKTAGQRWRLPFRVPRDPVSTPTGQFRSPRRPPGGRSGRDRLRLSGFGRHAGVEGPEQTKPALDTRLSIPAPQNRRSPRLEAHNHPPGSGSEPQPFPRHPPNRPDPPLKPPRPTRPEPPPRPRSGRAPRRSASTPPRLRSRRAPQRTPAAATTNAAQARPRAA